MRCPAPPVPAAPPLPAPDPARHPQAGRRAGWRARAVGALLLMISLGGCGGGGGAGAGSGSSASSGATTTETIDVLTCVADDTVTIAGNQRLTNNAWNRAAVGSASWSQCLRRRTTGSTIQYGWQWSWPTSSLQVLAYPEVVIGAKPWEGGAGNDIRFPRRISATTRMPLSFSVDSTSSGDRNLSVSLWITRDGATPTTPDPSRIVAEIMVWADYTPAMVSNDGSVTLLGQTTAGGRSFDVWASRNWNGGADTGTTWNFVVYVDRSPGPSMSVDLLTLVNDAIARGFASSSDYIASFELGNEVVNGSGSTWIQQLSLDLL